MNHLIDLGFGPFFLRQLDPSTLPHPPVGRVVFVTHAHVRLALPDGQVVAGLLDRTLHDRHDPVVVGDWVLVQRGDPWTVTRRLDRQRELRRLDPDGSVQRLGVNVDRLVVAFPADQPLNRRRLERWIAVADDADATLQVVVTRADLADPTPAQRAADQLVPGTALAVAAPSGEGVEALRTTWGRGETVALIGQSGVGKSTLANALIGVEQQATQAIRTDGRGRHTTSRRELLRLPDGAWLLDNPGIRGVGVANADAIGAAFPEVDALLGTCRFRDCKHDREPGCALLKALEDGRIQQQRMNSYRSIIASLPA